jgi:hypothetical protein
VLIFGKFDSPNLKGTPVKAIIKAICSAAILATLSASAFAIPTQNPTCPPGQVLVGPGVCGPAEVPEPSSPLLFLAAAAVGGVVLKLRKK